MTTSPSDDVHAWVQDYYGAVLTQSADLQTNACCAAGAPSPRIAQALANIDDAILRTFYGCGYPIPHVLQGMKVVDLGCGSGRDVYVLSQLVGPSGHVHGVDMTPAQLKIAQSMVDMQMQRFGFDTPNVSFHRGYIEDLGHIEEGSQDLVVSNCVVNLSPRKDIVLAQVARALKHGGEFYFSDVFCDRRLPHDIATDPLLHAECLGGAMVLHDFLDLAKAAGFADPREIERAPITIQNPEIERKIHGARFESVTLRLFKLPECDTRCEDYGQVATYLGGVKETPIFFWLDDHHLFEKGRPERVCGNTAAMLTKTRLADHFSVQGTTEVHYGPFPCGPTIAAAQRPDAPRDGIASTGSAAKTPEPSSSGCC